MGVLVTIGVSGGVAAIVAAALAGSWAPGVALALAAVCTDVIIWCNWWLNTRLICLGGDISAVGVINNLVLTPPSPSAFAFEAYDTDYSFNLLLWPFPAGAFLPSSFVGTDSPGNFNAQEWGHASRDRLWKDYAYWEELFGPPGSLLGVNYELPSGEPIQAVKNQVELMIPQDSMESQKLPFTGQQTSDVKDYSLTKYGDSDQQLLLHCEIEGRGILDLRTLMGVLLSLFLAAAALSFIPVIGSILAWILAALAFLAFLIAGPAVQFGDQVSPGVSVNILAPGKNSKDPVDLVYVYGRWVYDSLHSGKNELHPVHFILKIGTAVPQGEVLIGLMPTNLGDIKAAYDLLYTLINDPSTKQLQAEPQNQWTLHPLLDGCIAGQGYPDPPPPQPTQ